MTNDAYRKARGLDKPFTATEAEAKAAWFAMNRTEILHRRKMDKAHGKRHPFMGDYVEDED